MTLREEVRQPGVMLGMVVYSALSIYLGYLVGNMAAGVIFALAAYAVVSNDTLWTSAAVRLGRLRR